MNNVEKKLHCTLFVIKNFNTSLLISGQILQTFSILRFLIVCLFIFSRFLYFFLKNSLNKLLNLTYRKTSTCICNLNTSQAKFKF